MSGDAGIESSKVLRILELSLTVFDTFLHCCYIHECISF